MLSPPFRPALLPFAAARSGDATAEPDDCCGADATVGKVQLGARGRLADLDPHVHCSVIGTCLSTTELRKLMGSFILVDGTSDLDIHHEAVRLISANADVARALHKALDRRHDATLQRFTRAKDEPALAALWDEALHAGEVPSAYWAVLTHRRITPELRQRVFGDVHMLSHLVGAANRADIRRLIALERETSELRERLDRQHERSVELTSERDRGVVAQESLRVQVAELQRQQRPASADEQALESALAEVETLSATVAQQAHRRDLAEQAALAVQQESRRLEEGSVRLRDQADELARELAAAELQLREVYGDSGDDAAALRHALRGKRLLYVGGRPSSYPAIKAVVLRHGGEFQRHDGGLEDRKGLLASALAWADLVVFPVDCVDHDSAWTLKRACQRQQRTYLPLRSASVASFVAAFASAATVAGDGRPNGLCIKHA